MIFVDTNYFLRFLLQAENRNQHEAAKKIFLEATGGKIEIFTSLIVIFEIYWVLSSFYGRRKAEISDILLNITSFAHMSSRPKWRDLSPLEDSSAAPALGGLRSE